MSLAEKPRRIVVLAAGAAVGLSATAIVLQPQVTAPTERLTAVQSALREGVLRAQVRGNASEWMQLACNSSSRKCND